MIVVDGSALVAVLRREPEAPAFNKLIAASFPVFVSAVSIMETSFVPAGSHLGQSAWEPLDELLMRLSFSVVPFDAGQMAIARDAFLRYGKGRHQARLNMGDCASCALARSRNLPLLFKGNDFARADLTSAA